MLSIYGRMVHVVYKELKTVSSVNYSVKVSLVCVRFSNEEFEACKKSAMLCETENFEFIHVKFNAISTTRKQVLYLNSAYLNKFNKINILAIKQN